MRLCAVHLSGRPALPVHAREGVSQTHGGSSHGSCIRVSKEEEAWGWLRRSGGLAAWDMLVHLALTATPALCPHSHSAKEAASVGELSDFHHVSPDPSPKEGAPDTSAPTAEELAGSNVVPKLAAAPPRLVSGIAGNGDAGACTKGWHLVLGC